MIQKDVEISSVPYQKTFWSELLQSWYAYPCAGKQFNKMMS